MIKSDRWIRRMAAEHRLIEPFEAGQVKEVDGRKVVSYGTSSYGYDIRCSNEFKIFTNINSTIVDPKAFDAKNFVDVGESVKKGQVLCIIEAMKLMNEIDCEYDGEIVNIYAENGQPVQYNERLFAIRTR